MKPVGILGGTFNPIHLGHLRLAEELAEALAIDTVLVVPAGHPPHRHPPGISAQIRLAMVDLAIAGNPRLRSEDYEARKSTPCYMVETLEHLRASLGEQVPLVLFLGADAFQGLTTWHQWRRLFDLAHLAVAHRPGFHPAGWDDILARDLKQEWHARRTQTSADLSAAPAGRVWLQAITQLDISASHIRALVAGGKSIRYLVPDPVLDYIDRHQLYRQEEAWTT